MQKFKPLQLSFWPFQIAGWTVFVLTVFFRIFIQTSSNPISSVELGTSLLSYLIFCFAGIMLTWALRYLYRYIYIKQYSFILVAGIVALSTIILSIAHLFIARQLSSLLIGAVYNSILHPFLVSVIWNMPVFFSWSVLYFGIKYWKKSVFEHERAEKANLLAQSAQLQMLRYQLNPHFLFNSLNSIWALIDEDKKASKNMVSELAEFLRYSLMSKNYSGVPLQQEIEAIRHYLSIEKKRFEEKLEVEFDIDQEAEDFPVLSFILNPLVENAIKYGMRTSALPLKIAIRAKVNGHSLTLQVVNSGKWVVPVEKDNEGGTGTGLQNIRLRLENAFPGKAGFDIGEFENRVMATISIHG